MTKADISFDFAFNQAPFDELKPTVSYFKGSGGLNRLFNFNVTLLVPTRDIKELDPADLMGTRATLTITDHKRLELVDQEKEQEQEQGEKKGPRSYQVKWQGVVSGLEFGDEAREWHLARVELTSILAPLRALTQNRIHLDSTTIDIIEESLKFGGISSQNFDFSQINRGSYPKRDFVFQYDEDLLAFINRNLEREGLALYHDFTGSDEVLRLADQIWQFPAILNEKGEDLIVQRSQVTSLDPVRPNNPIFLFRAQTKIPPEKIRLKDYNWLIPNAPLEITVPVSLKGRGEVYLFGENFDNETEGTRLANIRKEEILASCSTFSGLGHLPGLIPGGVFTLEDEAIEMFNDSYLVTAFETEGRQGGAPSNFPDLSPNDAPFYRHSFNCQKADQPFRPLRVTPARKISGSLTAWIDGSGSGDKPEIDSHGRYKVLLPLDISGRNSGKASAWIRQAQPSVGLGYGQSFPLYPGVEVVLTFIDGNPDRPLINAAVANGETGPNINSVNSETSGITSKGGGGIVFLNAQGSNTLTLVPGIRGAGIFFTSGLSETDEEQNTALENQQDKLEKQDEEINKLKAKNSASTAVFNADTIEDNANYNKIVSVFDGQAIAGNKFEIKASVADLKTRNQFVRMAMEAKSKYNTVIKNSLKMSGEYDDSQYGAGTPADKMLQRMDLGLSYSDDIFKYAKLLDKVDSINKELAKVDSLTYTPMVELSISNDGACKGTWHSKKVGNLAEHIQNYALLNSIMSMESNFSNYLENFESAESSAKKGEFDKAEAKHVKAIGAFESVIASILNFECMVRALDKKSPKNGFVINNEDSYVNIKSKEQTVISATGPIILESLTSGRQVDLAASKEFSASLDKKLLKPEIFSESYFKKYDPYKDFHGILMRTILQRTLATEINQQAHGALLNKAGRLIQLTTGNSKEDPIKKKRDIFRKKYWAKAKIVDPKSKMPPAAVLNAHADCQDPTILNFSKDFEHGILLETREEKQHIQLRTVCDTGSLSFYQTTNGLKFSELKPTECRSFTLDKEGIILTDAKERALEIHEKEASFYFKKNVGLHMKDQEIKITCGDPNSLAIEKGDLTVKMNKNISFKANADFKAEASKKVTIKGGPNVTIDASIINIG
ncbi:MAG: type VI secretion system tip protein VgrG [Deltaproteobacteria bacterium]|jgi:type VI secretion system VgrG family protein|nr:type VI secretion system tip protein VgrG [Deltaproteobacteria bacterium]